MTPIQKIISVLSGTEQKTTVDEESVVIMACHLTALHIARLPDKAARSAAVAALPANLADAIKAEIVQAFEQRKPTNSTT